MNPGPPLCPRCNCAARMNAAPPDRCECRCHEVYRFIFGQPKSAAS